MTQPSPPWANWRKKSARRTQSPRPRQQGLTLANVNVVASSHPSTTASSETTSIETFDFSEQQMQRVCLQALCVTAKGFETHCWNALYETHCLKLEEKLNKNMCTAEPLGAQMMVAAWSFVHWRGEQAFARGWTRTHMVTIRGLQMQGHTCLFPLVYYTA